MKTETGYLEIFLRPLQELLKKKLDELPADKQIAEPAARNVPQINIQPQQPLPPAPPVVPAQAPVVPPPQPQIQPPDGIEAPHSFMGPKVRADFNRWLTNNGLDMMAPSADKKTYLGNFKNGIEFVVHDNKVLFHKKSGEKLTAEELKESIENTIKMLKEVHGEGNVPPLRPLGTDEQKEIIKETLEKLGVKIKPEPVKREEGGEEAPAPAPGNGANRR